VRSRRHEIRLDQRFAAVAGSKKAAAALLDGGKAPIDVI
jgi:hypothetical protein